MVQRLERSNRIIWIHDLVQLLLRSKLMTNTERAQWLEIAICITCRAFKEIGNRRSPQNWILCSEFVTHIQAMERFAEQCGRKSVELMDASMWTAIYFDERGFYQEAASIYERVWDKRKDVLGAEHPDTLTSMNNLAEVYRHQGRWKEAEKLHMQVMETRKIVLGAEHPNTLASINNLAHVYKDQHRNDEAIEMMKLVVRLSTKIKGADHPDTVASMKALRLWTEHEGSTQNV